MTDSISGTTSRSTSRTISLRDLALWGGVECTINRVHDRYFSQLDRSGHASRREDLDRFASLGVKALRYPVLWESVAPDGADHADWSWPDERLIHLHQLGIEPIVGLVHHGSGPSHTSLLDPAFAAKLASYAGAVAARYPWVQRFTPVNEPLTTARFSALYGVWYPHAKDDGSFITAVLNQCRATVLAMRAIREIIPGAQLVQTDDLGKTYSTPQLSALADFYNQRRWLAWDLLCGLVQPGHALWDYLISTGIDAGEFLWFRDHPCPPAVIGVNYYITSERWLDHRHERYPAYFSGRYRDYHCVDIETPRAFATPTPGIAPLLMEAWQRYRLPLAVTEAHIDANREDQLRWFTEIWNGAQQAQQQGAQIEAVTSWALLGSFDWNCLVTRDQGYYEPGPFDIRSPQPRPTALARLLRELSVSREPSHPVLQAEGWWRRAGRFLCPPVTLDEMAVPFVSSSPAADKVMDKVTHSVTHRLAHSNAHEAAPLLILGASGTLGRAFARICSARNLAFRVFGRSQLDIANAAAVEAVLREHQPWAVINAGGYVRVDEAETERERCYRENTQAAVVLAVACVRHGLPLLTFSTDLVFDGAGERAYVESDPTAPLNVYGQSKAEAERRVLAICPDALVIRTSAFFGPWDSVNFLTLALNALSARQPFVAAANLVVSPTYVPDLVHTSLNLLIDAERGLWHLSNHEAISWAGFARKAASMAGISDATLEARAATELRHAARRPLFSALSSERATLMPSLDDALERYLRLRAEALEEDETGLMPLHGRS